MISAASSAHIIMALQSSERQQNSLVFWTWWQLSVACGLFFISRKLDALSRAMGRGITSRIVPWCTPVLSQGDVQLRGVAREGKSKNPGSLPSGTSVIPCAKVVWQYALPFLGLSILKDSRPSSRVLSSGCFWLCPFLPISCTCTPLGALATALGQRWLQQECQPWLLEVLCPRRAVWNFCFCHSYLEICFWKRCVLLDVVLKM